MNENDVTPATPGQPGAVHPASNPADIAMSALLMLATGLGLTWFARSAVLAESACHSSVKR